MMEATNARRDAFLEAIARRKYEKEAVNALCKVRLIYCLKTFMFRVLKLIYDYMFITISIL